MTSRRPYLNSHIDKLEKIYLANRDNVSILQELANELENRFTDRAKKLREEVFIQLKLITDNPVSIDDDSRIINDLYEKDFANIINEKDINETNTNDSEALYMNRKPVTQERQDVAKKLLADLRIRLLDLKNNSRLLNFPFSERSRSHIRIIDELPDQLYSKLLENDALIFKSLPQPEDEPADEQTDEFELALEAARISDAEYLKQLERLDEKDDITSVKGQKIERALKDRIRQQLSMPTRISRDTMSNAEYAKAMGFNPAYDLPKLTPDEPSLPKHQDDKIQTLLFPDQMERKLSGLNDQTRTGLKEMGINALFCAFGFLEWYESENSDRCFFAPLLLHPIEITRELVRQVYKYSIQSTGERTETNLTLRERLRHDFSLELPQFDEDRTPEDYFLKVEDMIRDFRRWRVRRFVTVGLCHFSRLAMYHDLDPDRWPVDQALESHNVLADLLAGAEKQESNIIPPEYHDDQLDISEMPILITDADSSQYSAIKDVLLGKNMAIKGPPGTGKSQTITNIIAAALNENKRILFLAEKMPALEVVKKRLDDAGLGIFCLELHSTKARKTAIREALIQRLNVLPTFEPPSIDTALAEQRKLRDILTTYVSLMNKQYGNLGKTLQEILWAELAIRVKSDSKQLPKELDDVYNPKALEINNYGRETAHSKLVALENSLIPIISSFDTIEKHPWYGCRQAYMSIYEQEKLINSVRNWQQSIHELKAVAQELLNFIQMTSPLTIQDMRNFIMKLSNDIFNEPIQANGEILAKLKTLSAVKECSCLSSDCRRYHEILHKLQAVINTTTPDKIKINENLSKLIDSCNLISTQTKKSNPSVNSLKEYAQNKKDSADKIQCLINQVYELYSIIHFNGPITITDVKSIISATNILSSTPMDAILRRRPILFDALHKNTLERGKAAATTLLSKRANLAPRFTIKTNLNPDMLRQQASVIRTAGLLSRLGKEYKSAVNHYRLICRGDTPNTNRNTVASDLETIADYVQEVNNFLKDEQLRCLCGDDFEGIDTCFDTLLVVNEYAKNVRLTFRGNSPLGALLRNFLLQAPIEELDCFIANISEQGSPTLIEECQPSLPTQDHDLETILATYKSDAKNLTALYTNLTGLEIKDDVPLSKLPEILKDLRSLDKTIEKISNNDKAKLLLGIHYSGIDSDVNLIEHHCQLASSILESNLPGNTAQLLLSQDYSGNKEKLSTLSKELNERISAAYKAQEEAVLLGQLDIQQMFSVSDIQSLDVDRIITRLEVAINGATHLPSWLDYYQMRDQVVQAGMGNILDAYDRAHICPHSLPTAFDKVLYHSIINRAIDESPALRQFSGTSHSTIQKSFQEFDKKIIDLSRAQISARLLNAHINPGVGTGYRRNFTDLALIRVEISKQIRHIPIRDLMQRAGRAIQQLKPCFMMSPSSVAQFISPESDVKFDLVVIDEASQMKPEEALGSIARGTQVVVVGDPQQLPPTSFFDRTEISSEEDENFEDYIDTESILDLALSTFRPSRNLLWHYRSRHESLIAFSNRNFYDNELILYPSPMRTHPDLGVEYHKVQGVYSNRINVIEAQEVIKEAISFMHTYPNRSLGIVTVNQTQRELIMEEMDRMFSHDKTAESYRKNWEETLESFFIKNLENVQGDERDVIFISTVYGPNETGKVLQRFGPINSVVGHRRLNVLFTRAKEKVVVFSSMNSSDILPGDTSNRGVPVLKDYLNYAKVGVLESAKTSGRPPDSDFEVVVANRLRSHGFDAVAQVGVSGYFIDIGVRDPNNPDNFILGIECDGATYHSAKSARDRDRLREEVLRNLKWNIYRIWSTDWFNDPSGQTKKLVAYLQSICRTSSNSSPKSE